MREQSVQSPPCRIRSFESSEELARVAARDWRELLQVLAMAGREESTVALSGGRIARTFFDAAARMFGAHRDLIRKVQFFWADERCVPPDHPDSNYGLAANHLLKPLGVPEARIHRIPGEIEPGLAAETAAKGLAKWTATERGQVPVLDLVFLGMGEDGHVASLFPGEPSQAKDSPDLFRVVTAAKPPPQRVTVSYDILAKAENVWVLVSGEGKKKALRDSLASADNTPLGRVLASRSSTCIYTDLSPAGGSAE